MKTYLDGSDKAFSPLKYQKGSWIKQYADLDRKLHYWITEKKWWRIRGAVDGVEREFLMLPVYHPARYGKYDSGYDNTVNTLRRMVSER